MTTPITNEDLHNRLKEICSSLHGMEKAFPKNEDGSLDVDGHRRYHESMIDAAKAQEAFWKELKLDLAKKGLWGILVLVIGFAVVGMLAKAGPYLK